MQANRQEFLEFRHLYQLCGHLTIDGRIQMAHESLYHRIGHICAPKRHLR